MSATVGRTVLRAAPWPALLGGCVVATALFGIAATLRHGPLAFPLSLLGLGLCGATAAYVLDEASAEVEIKQGVVHRVDLVLENRTPPDAGAPKVDAGEYHPPLH